MKRVIPLAAFLTLAILSVHAQNVGEILPRLTNKEILEMVNAGLSSDVIIAKIKVSRCNFDTEPSVLAELKQKGVSDELLKAMIGAPYGQPQVESYSEVRSPGGTGRVVPPTVCQRKG